MLPYFNKPYPFLRNTKRNVTTNIIVGVFITLFLMVFKPFGVDLWQTDNKLLKLAGFGFISFFVPTLILFLLILLVPRKVLEDSWRIGYEILSIVITLCGIALGNLIYGNYLHIMQFSFTGYISTLLVVISIGVFPVTFYVLSTQNKLLKINLENAGQINNSIKAKSMPPVFQSNDQIILLSENEKDKLQMESSQLFYIESSDNYSTIIFNAHGSKKKSMLRGSLKRMESQLNIDHIVRCHRAYIINLRNVKHVEGNAAGYKVKFEGLEESIPVSRTYSAEVIEKLKSLNPA